MMIATMATVNIILALLCLAITDARDGFLGQQQFHDGPSQAQGGNLGQQQFQGGQESAVFQDGHSQAREAILGQQQFRDERESALFQDGHSQAREAILRQQRFRDGRESAIGQTSVQVDSGAGQGHMGSSRSEGSGNSKTRVSQRKKNCTNNHLQKCMDLLQTLNKDHNLAFASTPEGLDKMCNTMQTGVKCVHHHVTRCFDDEKQKIFFRLLRGTEDVIGDLCEPGYFREQFQLHAPCMKNLSTETGACGAQYTVLIQSVTPSEKDKEKQEDNIRQQCCAFHSYLLCVTSAATEECGTNASNFIEEYSYRTAGPIIQTRCKVFIPGSEECMASAAALSQASESLLSASLLLLLPMLSTTLC